MHDTRLQSQSNDPTIYHTRTRTRTHLLLLTVLLMALQHYEMQFSINQNTYKVFLQNVSFCIDLLKQDMVSVIM